MLDGRADLAVHSAKDLPSVTVDGLVLAAVPERADPRDALVGATLADLPAGAPRRHRLGPAAGRSWPTSGPTSRSPSCGATCDTRLAKAADFDAIVVAVGRASSGSACAEHAHRDPRPRVMRAPGGAGRAGGRVPGRRRDACVTLLAAIEHAPSRRRGRRRAGVPRRARRRLRPPGRRPRRARRRRAAAPRRAGLAGRGSRSCATTSRGRTPMRSVVTWPAACGAALERPPARALSGRRRGPDARALLYWQR